MFQTARLVIAVLLAMLLGGCAVSGDGQGTPIEPEPANPGGETAGIRLPTWPEPVPVGPIQKTMSSPPARRPREGVEPPVLPVEATTVAPAVERRDDRLRRLAREQLSRLSVVIGWRTLRWGRQTPLEVTVASADLPSAERAAAAMGGAVQKGSAALGYRVRAELTGADVSIANPAALTQDVTSLENVTWTWMVQPTRPGAARLKLRLYNQIVDGSSVVEVALPAYERELEVAMSWWQQVTWWLSATGPVRLAGWAGLAAASGAVVWLLQFLGLWRRWLRQIAGARARMRAALGVGGRSSAGGADLVRNS